MIAKIYYWLLWVTGFKDIDNNPDTPEDREKITFMLRRMRQRNAVVWWTLIVGAITGSFGLLAFFIWLLFHVIWTTNIGF